MAMSSRYDKPTPPDRPAVSQNEILLRQIRHKEAEQRWLDAQDNTPTNPQSYSVPLRAPTHFDPGRHLDEPITRAEFEALKGEVSRIACDQASIQEIQMASLRSRRKRISDRVRASVTPERAGKALIVFALLALPAVLERLGYSGLADVLRLLGGQAHLPPVAPQ